MGGGGLPKVCCQRPSRFGHLCSQWSGVCGSSLHSGHVGSVAGSSRWACALRSCVCVSPPIVEYSSVARIEGYALIDAYGGCVPCFDKIVGMPGVPLSNNRSSIPIEYVVCRQAMHGKSSNSMFVFFYACMSCRPV